MMTYIVLNTMIWAVVYLSGHRIEPSNYEDKEVYRWGMTKRDLPRWIRFIRKVVFRRGDSVDHTKDDIDIADNDSTIHNGSSRLGSADNKDVFALSERTRSPRPLSMTR